MIPLHDDNPTHLRPLITVGLIVVCVCIYLWEIGLSENGLIEVFYSFGFIPSVWFEAYRENTSIFSFYQFTIISSMFLHGGFFHLAGNMLYLWIFGNNVEESMGHIRFLIFYILCGSFAAMAQAFYEPNSYVPMVGASGAIGGVLGAYFVLYPKARVLVLVPLGIIFWTMRIPAAFVLGGWFIFQLLLGSSTVSEVGGVAYWAHIGGFISGVILLFLFKNKDTPVWNWSNKPRGFRKGPWN